MTVRARDGWRRFGSVRIGPVEIVWGRWHRDQPFMLTIYLGDTSAVYVITGGVSA